MERWNDAVYDYILGATRMHDPLLDEMEARAERERFPIIGPHVGPWLYTLTRLTYALRVYELGSGYGYSTWYFASAVRDNLAAQGLDAVQGKVMHTVWDAQLSADAQVNLERAGLKDFCSFVNGEAVAALREAEPGWDIIFNDIDKEGYPAALPVIEEKLRPGGLLLVDNILWSGAVADPADQRPSTVAIRKLNDMLRDSPRWEYLILPLRDGLGIARFKG